MTSLPGISFVLGLHSELGYSAGVLEALRLIALDMFGAVY